MKSLRLWLSGLLLSISACSQSETSGQYTGASCDPYLIYELDIAPLMERYCVSCHASTLALTRRHGAPGDHDFDSEQGLLDNADHVELVAAAGPDAENHSMPPKGWPQPDEAERRLLGQWLACQGTRAPGGHAH